MAASYGAHVTLRKLFNFKVQSQMLTRLGVDKVKPKGWFKFFFYRQVVGTILKLSYILNFFVGHLLYG